MRIAKLLVLGALFLMGSNVVKAVDGSVWSKPTVTEFASLVNGEVYYFYLPGCQLFFTQGNAYGTQASAGTTGGEFFCQPSSITTYGRLARPSQSETTSPASARKFVAVFSP